MRFLSSAVFWLILPASARDKTDVLVMKNGDRITCEVKRVEGGLLEVNLEYVDGTLLIDWTKVSRIETNALFAVKLQDGSTYWGKILIPDSLPGTPVQLGIQQSDAVNPVFVPRSEVVRMTQTSLSFLQRFNGGVTLGSQYSKGNSAVQYNVGSDLGYEESRWGFRTRYNSNLSLSAGSDAATRNRLDSSIYRLLSRNNYFLAGSAAYLQSSVQGIQNQTTLGFGLGMFLKNTNQMRFTLLGGLAWQRTNYILPETNGTQNIGAVLVNSRLEAFRFKKTRLAATVNLVPALTDRGRLFLNTDVAYFLTILGTLDWNFSFYGSWDSRPPAHLPGSDYGSSTGLSWSFGNR
jgi:hypothetical protein